MYKIILMLGKLVQIQICYSTSYAIRIFLSLLQDFVINGSSAGPCRSFLVSLVAILTPANGRKKNLMNHYHQVFSLTICFSLF